MLSSWLALPHSNHTCVLCMGASVKMCWVKSFRMVMQYRDIKYCLIQFGRRDWPASRYLGSLFTEYMKQMFLQDRRQIPSIYVCWKPEIGCCNLNFGKPGNKMTLPPGKWILFNHLLHLSLYCPLSCLHDLIWRPLLAHWLNPWLPPFSTWGKRNWNANIRCGCDSRLQLKRPNIENSSRTHC